VAIIRADSLFCYLAVDGEDNIIGTCGFTAPPDADGVVETHTSPFLPSNAEGIIPPD